MTDETEMAIRALEARIDLQDARIRASRDLMQAVAGRIEVIERMLTAHAADLGRASGAADDLQAQLSDLKRLAP